MSRITSKSVEHQLRNTTLRLRNLVAAADVLTAAWDAGGKPTPGALTSFQECKNKLALDTRGVVGIVQLRRVLIEPELDALQTHPDARSAVLSLCDWIAEQTRDAPDRSAETFSDEEITTMISQSRRGFFARLLGVTE